MDDSLYLGIDLGGTKCAAVLGDRHCRVLKRRFFETGASLRPQEALDRIKELIFEILRERGANRQDIAALGVSSGGPLDSEQGVILSPPNLPLWDRIEICKYFSQALSVPCYLQNDANACALAEWRFGAGRGAKNMIFLTFGTGMGAGLILNGQLYEGARGMAGEVGHVRVSNDGPEGYGKIGSFEGFCSGGGLHRLAKMCLGLDLSARELCEMAEYGDDGAKAVLSESARKLGEGLSVLIDILNPEVIVIGSVFARAEKWFREEMTRALERETLPTSLAACRVVKSELGDALGDMAALAVAIGGSAKAQ